MAVCDICNAPGLGTSVSATKIRQCASLGFNPYSECAAPTNPMAAMMGMSASGQFEAWKQQVAQDTTDWNVCPKCMRVLERYLQPDKADAGSKAAMFENVLRTRGVPCDRCRKAVPVPRDVISEAASAMAADETWQFKCPECGGIVVMSPQTANTERPKQTQVQRGQSSSAAAKKKWWQFWK
jgi:hypothetical protein